MFKSTGDFIQSEWKNNLIILLFFSFIFYLISQNKLDSILAKTHFDDALFFIRYAHNFWNGNGLVFNALDAPSYGATSLLHQLFVILLYPFFETYSSFASNVFYLLFVLIFFRKFSTTLLYFSLIPMFVNMFSGMETSLSVLVVLYFINSIQNGRFYLFFYPLAYITRPDLMLLVIGLHVYFLANNYENISKNFKAILISLVKHSLSLFGVLMCLSFYFGSPFPLSGYVKSFGTLYNQENEALDTLRYANIEEFDGLFGLLLMFSITALLISLYVSKDVTRKEALILIITIISFAIYHAFGVEYPILNGGARYFIPTVPILGWVLFKSLSSIFEDKAYKVYIEKLFRISLIYAFFIGDVHGLRFLSVQSDWFPRVIFNEIRSNPAFDRQSSSDFILIKAIEDKRWPLWFLSDKVPSHCSIMDTELGAISILDYDRYILDASGLTNRDLMLTPTTLQEQLAVIKPDFINKKFVVDFYKLIMPEQLNEYVTVDSMLVRKDSECIKLINSSFFATNR